MLTLDAFERAATKVKEVTLETKLIESPHFSAIAGNRVFFKPENMQRTGSYKVRGAYYKISTMSDEERSHGLITASAGNHAQGVAAAAQKYGVPATIVMPATTPLIKVERTKSYGANVELVGNVYDEAYARACELAEEQGLTFVHPLQRPRRCLRPGHHRHGNLPGASAGRLYSRADRRRWTCHRCFHSGKAAQP